MAEEKETGIAKTTGTIYKSVVLEIRPRLQSVNVCALVGTEVEKVEVTLNDNSLQLLVNHEVITVSLPDLIILKTTQPKIKIHGKYVSFRFQTSTELGSFKSELLINSQQTSELRQQDLEKTLPNKGKPCVLKCINCTNALSGEVHFTRVLPLPSEAVDPAEWYCHPQTSSNTNLNPKVTDLFFTNWFAHVNSGILINVKCSNRIVVCNRCLCWLGVEKNEHTIHFWFNTVGIQHGNTFLSSIALFDVFETIKDVMKRSSWIKHPKFIFVCQSAQDRTDYLILWVMESNLRLLLYIDKENEDNTFQNVYVSKVLFRFHDEKIEFVEQWLSASDVMSVLVSKPMIHALLTHLHVYNKLISEEFNKSNGFSISYLLMH